MHYFLHIFSGERPERGVKRAALRGESSYLPAACMDAPLGQRQEGCSDSPSLPLDSTHPATGQGLHALDDPKEEGSTGKTEDSRLFGVKIF